MNWRMAWVAALGVTAFALVTLGVHAASGAPERFLVAEATTGMAFVVAGLVGARHRPATPAGPMLILCGALWFLSGYAATGQPVLAELGFAFEGYYDLVLAILLLLLAAPGGSPRPMALVLALAGAMAVRSVARLVLLDPPAIEPAFPPNPFAMLPDQAMADRVEVATSAAIVVLSVVVAVIAVRRLQGGGTVARRARWPLVLAGVLAMAGAAYRASEYAWGTATGTGLVALSDPVHEVFQWTMFALRTLVPVAFVVGVLRMRGAVGPLGPLAAGLGATAGSGGMRGDGTRGRPDGPGEAARSALGDPSVVLLRIRADGAWATEDGEVVTLPVPQGERWVTIVGAADAPVGALLHDQALLDHPELLDGVATVLRLALDNERLDGELRAQLDEVRESRARMVAATEDERRRLERDLHDGAQQRLVAATLALQDARRVADAPGAPPDLRPRLDALADELAAATRELRELARGIHPAILEHEGLRAAIGSLARRSAIPVEVRVDVPDRLPDVVESTAYFTVAEALTNAQRYAQASRARVAVSTVGNELEVEVVDDGVGGANPDRGTGLKGLADRMHALGGELRVESGPGRGTALRARIPVT